MTSLASFRAGKSRARARRSALPDGFPAWYVWLSAHALTHGGAVYVVTGLWYLGAIESVLHAGIDHLKCEDRITFNQDQALHLVCKAAYCLALA